MNVGMYENDVAVGNSLYMFGGFQTSYTKLDVNTEAK